MAELLKVAGKSASGTSEPLSLTDNGELVTSRRWNSTVVDVYPLTEIRTDTYKLKRLDVSNYGLISFRVNNQLDADVTLVFYGEYVGDVDDRLLLRDINTGDYFRYTIKQGYHIITPDDIPFLNYFEHIYMGFKANTVPTEGTLQIWGVFKG